MIPTASIIVPSYNEESTIADLLNAIVSQTFPIKEIEVIIADGLSTDATRYHIQEFIDTHPGLHVRMIDNPQRIIPAALNLAIREARGDYIIRLDAHSIPQVDYVERCVELLDQKKYANVGGVWDIRPGSESAESRAIAFAAGHPLGAGDARYRIKGEAGEVDTVPFGAFLREWIELVGWFNEELLSNEDYEFNARLRNAGGVIWFDPSIRSIYIARSNLTDLARQYWRYGYWKFRMLRSFPESLRWRQWLPPLFVGSGLLLLVLIPFTLLAAYLFMIQMGGYLLALIFSGLLQAWVEKDLALIFWFPLAIMAMHLSWGGGFLWSLVTSVRGNNREG